MKLDNKDNNIGNIDTTSMIILGTRTDGSYSCNVKPK
jgi:hypothetical protein